MLPIFIIMAGLVFIVLTFVVILVFVVMQVFDLELGGILRPFLRFVYLDGTVLIFVTADELAHILQLKILLPFVLGQLAPFGCRLFDAVVIDLIIWLTLLA